MSEQQVIFLEKDIKNLKSQLDTSEFNVQDLRKRLNESESIQASFASKNDETLKGLQMQLEQNKSFEMEQMRMQYEA